MNIYQINMNEFDEIHSMTLQDILKAKSNFTLFIFEYISTLSDFKQMEHCN